MNVTRIIREGKYIGTRRLRENLSSILKSRRSFFVTDNGEPVKVLVPYGVFLELLEILEELKDRSLLREIAKGRKEYQRGGWVSVGKRRKRLK